MEMCVYIYFEKKKNIFQLRKLYFIKRDNMCLFCYLFVRELLVLLQWNFNILYVPNYSYNIICQIRYLFWYYNLVHNWIICESLSIMILSCFMWMTVLIASRIVKASVIRLKKSLSVISKSWNISSLLFTKITDGGRYFLIYSRLVFQLYQFGGRGVYVYTYA